MQPLILTLQLDARADAYFQEMRRRHFPPSLNIVPAHLTLFHQLPGDRLDAVMRRVGETAIVTQPFNVTVAGLRKLGRGVAYLIESDALTKLRAQLAAGFSDWLIAQDKEPFRPHVTIQNKVAPHEAAALYDHLTREFVPFEATAEGVQIWRYEGGPWRAVAAVPFSEADRTDGDDC